MRKITMFKKKNAAMTFVMTLIIMIACAIVLFAVTPLFAQQMSLDEAINVCKLSVFSQSKTETTGGRGNPLYSESVFNLQCNTRYINFYNNRVEVGLSPEKTQKKPIYINGEKKNSFSQLNEFIVNQVVAEEMRICKTQFGDGRSDIFPNDDGIFTDQKICFICSEINFKGMNQRTFTGLIDYTKGTAIGQINLYDDFTSKTIYDYPLWTQATDEPLGFPTNLDFDTRYTYYVLIQKWASASVDILYKTGIRMNIVQKDDLNKYCDLVAH
jgi:hypothetical protein